MHLLLVAGFLGSGKTTLILSLARAAQTAGRRTAIIVNEIGEIGIDNQLMRQLDLDVWELFNGCICCTLTTDLVTTLQKLDSDYAPDLVVVEPSGAADPKNLLHALPYYRGRPLASIRWVTVLDPLRLPMLLDVLEPLITAGIRQGDFLIISKADIATPEELAEATDATRAINPTAPLYCLALGGDLPSELLPEFAGVTDLLFEPYALQQRWTAVRPLEPDEWAVLFGEYLARLAGACAGAADVGPNARNPVIGHIKLLALFDGQEYLRVSAVSATHPPTITGATPAGLAEVTVTLNVLVYGLPRDRLAALTSITASEVAKRWGVCQT